MYRVRYRVNQHGWQFIQGCFPTKNSAIAAMYAHADSKDGAYIVSKYQVVLKAWYANR